MPGEATTPARMGPCLLGHGSPPDQSSSRPCPALGSRHRALSTKTRFRDKAREDCSAGRGPFLGPRGRSPAGPPSTGAPSPLPTRVLGMPVAFAGSPSLEAERPASRAFVPVAHPRPNPVAGYNGHGAAGRTGHSSVAGGGILGDELADAVQGDCGGAVQVGGASASTQRRAHLVGHVPVEPTVPQAAEERIQIREPLP